MISKTTIRRVGSLFFLGIFVWFYSVKDIHDVVHRDDVHCHVLNAQHFHTQEHHCPVCDFEFPGFDEQNPTIHVASHKFYIKVQFAALAQVISCEPSFPLPSRAPPVVA